MERKKCLRMSLIMLAVLMSCVRSPQVDELPGVYVIHYDFGRETLVLRADGTYEQTFDSTAGKTYRNSGKWAMIGSDLQMQNAMVVDDGFGKMGAATNRANWTLKVGRIDQRIVFIPNPDREERYEKQGAVSRLGHTAEGARLI